jgi:hypothetical protein
MSAPQPLHGEYSRLVSRAVSTSLEEIFGKSTAKFIEQQMQRAEPS